MKRSRLPTIFNQNVVKLSVAVALAIAISLWWFRISDPHIKQTEQFLYSSPELSEKIGELENLHLIRTNIFFRETDSGRAKEPHRKQYRFVANGKIAKAEVIVLVTLNNENAVESIEIESINL